MSVKKCLNCTFCRTTIRLRKGKFIFPGQSTSCHCAKNLWYRETGMKLESVIYKSVMNKKFRYNPDPWCPSFDGEGKEEV